MRPLVVIRRIIQLAFFGLFFYILFSTTYPLHGKLPASLLFQADPLVMMITSISERVVLSGIAISLVLCLAAVLLGRFFCGWFCPLGAIFDFFRMFYSKRRQQAGKLPRQSRRVKFGILAILFLLALIGIQGAWLLDPLVITARFFSLNIIPAVTQAINQVFIFFIQKFGLYAGFYDFYRGLKESILGIHAYYFSHSLFVFLFTTLIIFSSIAIARFWCRMLCPLGAGYGLLARFARLRRYVNASCNHCNNCTRRCRMEAIAEAGVAYDSKECILCMDCIYDCPQKAVSFGFIAKAQAVSADNSSPRITRRQLFILLFAGLFSLGAKSKKEGPGMKRRVIRPPAALSEREFLDRCIRCGNCMKVCITNGLQPCLFESGLEGVWTPHLVPEIGYCEYHCTLCGKVCPTAALKPLTEKEKAKEVIGIAVIDKSICLPWSENKECIVCEEHCPTSDKAIKLKRVDPDAPSRPYVDKKLCVGCGICQTKCPINPVRAIRVKPL
jgi:polyferredoxin